MKSKYWIIGWFTIVIIGLSINAIFVYNIDPYMHYHKPNTSKYFYELNNQRSQNDGITKYFKYDAMITGTSMTENFKKSEMDKLFGCNSIKVSYSGGTYREMNDNLKSAIKHNSNLKIVVRALDMDKFFDDKDLFREDLGEYPRYLYDKNPFNDVQYVLNRDVIWNKSYKMVLERNKEGFEPGITSFDEYSRWQDEYEFGVKSIEKKYFKYKENKKLVHLTEQEKKSIKENITQNVTALAEENPQITFYYFFPLYSALWWKGKYEEGTIARQVEAEEYIIELILKYDNIKLYSFNNRTDITTDLNHYKDTMHYGEWINSLILKWMYEGKYQLTKDNYKEYIYEEKNNYLNMNYYQFKKQEDYKNDYYAAALINQEITGEEPVNLLNKNIKLNNANYIINQNNNKEIECIGKIKREANSKKTLLEYIINDEYIGAKIEVENVDNYNYIVLYGKKVNDHGQPTIYVLDNNNLKVKEISLSYTEIEEEWNQYLIDISDLKGNITIILNGGYIDNTGSDDSKYIFSNIYMY